MKSMIIKYLLVLAIIPFVIKCSSSKEISIFKEISIDKLLSQKEKHRLALDNIIDGTIYLENGNYNLALKKFQNALNFDSSAGIYYLLAKAYLFNNKLNLALQYANKAIQLDSSSSEYYLLLSDIYIYGKQKQNSIIVLEEAAEKFPENHYILIKYANYIEENRPLQAVQIYEKILKVVGNDWNILTRIIDIHRRLGNLDAEISSLERLLKLHPGNTSIIKNLIELYILQKRNDEALVLLEELLELNPDDVFARLNKLQIYLVNLDWKNMEDEAKQIISTKNTDFNLLTELGYFFIERSFAFPEALNIAKMIYEKLDSDTSHWQIKLVLGTIAINQGEYEKAIEYFNYITENARWNLDAWVKLGALHYDNKKYLEAEKILSEAVELFPDEYLINFILALSLSQQGKNEIAVKYIKKSFELNPQDVNTISAYGFILNQINQKDSAIYYLNKALLINSEDVSVIGTLALIYNEKQNYQISDSLYEKALIINPDDPIINNNYAYSLSTRGLQLERALKMVEIALADDSLSAAFLDTKGWILYKLGRYEEAKYFVEKAVSLDSKSAVLIDHLADIEFKLGNQKKAIELWKKAFEIDPNKKEIQEKINKGGI